MRATFVSAVALLAIAAASRADAAVSVVYVDAARYTDGRLESRFGRKSDPFVERDLRQYLEQLGARYLTPEQTLKVEILDIDLAGRVTISRAPGENLRVLTDGTWPRIKLRYTLEQGGAVTASAEEWVVDQTYLTRIGYANASDPLRYEKRMLNAWFQKRFGKEQAAVR